MSIRRKSIIEYKASIEQTLMPEQTSESDIRVRTPQGRNAFFDTRVPPLKSLFQKIERKKENTEKGLNEIEHGSFTPLVFSDLATKINESYSRW